MSVLSRGVAAEGMWPADIAAAPGMSEEGGIAVAGDDPAEDEIFVDDEAALEEGAADLELPDGALEEEP